ncbi:hypothetical protein FXO37_25702 [Capsicum annuum]|nr:hypothetical protein FXO37_25702 [Capsicum annuum]
MERVAEGLWVLADYEEKKGEIGKSVKCLEAICQSQVSFLPIIEIKTRLRIANLLLNHSNNVNHAKSHLERSQLLLKSIPSCFELKCRAYSLLSQCYQLVGAIPSQKQILNKGLELISTSEDGVMLVVLEVMLVVLEVMSSLKMSFLMLRGKIEYSEEIARKAELMLKYDELIKGGNLRKTKIKNTLAKRG